MSVDGLEGRARMSTVQWGTGGGPSMSDRPVRYGMILLDTAPAILRVRGQPIIFKSPEETVDYARLHAVQRWLVFGDPDCSRPLSTQFVPVNPPPPPKGRIVISYAS